MPLRPEFLINIEVYCLQTGSEITLTGFSTPVSKSSRVSSIALSSPITCSARKCLGIRNLLSSKSKKHKYRVPPQSSTPTDLSAAFTLLSSVQIHHSDDLLYGRYPPTMDLFSNTPKVEDISGVEMPLVLMGLPRSAPLTGRLGMCDVAVRLQSSVLKRGFLVSSCYQLPVYATLNLFTVLPIISDNFRRIWRNGCLDAMLVQAHCWPIGVLALSRRWNGYFVCWRQAYWTTWYAVHCCSMGGWSSA